MKYLVLKERFSISDSQGHLNDVERFRLRKQEEKMGINEQISLLDFREKRVLGPDVEESMPSMCSRNRCECIVRRWGRGPVGADRSGAACGPRAQHLATRSA